MKHFKHCLLLVLLAPCLVLTMGVDGCPPPPEPPVDDGWPMGEVEYPLVAPHHAYATARHVGEGRWGTAGVVGNPVLEARFAPDNRGSLMFSYAFEAPDPTEFVGTYFAFGRTALDLVNPDGSDGGDLLLNNDSTVNLLDFKQTETVALDRLRISFGEVTPDGGLTLKIEMTDGNGARAFVRQKIRTGAQYDFPLSSFALADLTRVKLISLLVEENHVGDNVHNPANGAFEITGISLVDDHAPKADAVAIADLDDAAMIEQIGLREFESLLRLRDAKTGALLDRTLFRDLIHWGSTGWLLAAMPSAVEKGWISEQEAIDAALRILRFVDNDQIWGNAPSGMVGNSAGLMYHFGGIDATGLNGPLTGTRKIDLGKVNAGEASVIDTALFQFGAATCAAGLGDAAPEIRTRVNSILSRTDWNALVEPDTGQLYLSWKPAQDAGFAAPASFGGYWASNSNNDPLTIDYWTDEGALASILAAGSDPDLASTWYAMIREQKDGAVVTWPGSFFTYAFFSAIYLPTDLGADQGGAWQTTPIDWRANARTIYTRNTMLLGSGVLPDAVEFPNNAYLAQGIPACSVDAANRYFGVQTPYSIELALGLGGNAAMDATQQLRALLQAHPELWDPYYGFLDSFHANLGSFAPPANLEHAAPLIRTEGEWIQQQAFSLNKGAALCALLNHIRAGAIANTARQHPRIAAGLDAIYGTK